MTREPLDSETPYTPVPCYIHTPLQRPPRFRFDRGQSSLLYAPGSAPSLVVRGTLRAPQRLSLDRSILQLVQALQAIRSRPAVRSYKPRCDFRNGMSTAQTPPVCSDRVGICKVFPSSKKTPNGPPRPCTPMQKHTNHRKEAYQAYRPGVEI